MVGSRTRRRVFTYLTPKQEGSRTSVCLTNPSFSVDMRVRNELILEARAKESSYISLLYTSHMKGAEGYII